MIFVSNKHQRRRARDEGFGSPLSLPEGMNLGLFQGLHQRVSRSSKTNKNSQMTERENPEQVNLEDGIPMGAGAQGAAAGGAPQDGGVERRDGPPRDGDEDAVRSPHEAALARTRRVTCAATTVAIVNATAVLLFWSSVVAVGVRNQSSSLQIDQSIQRAKGSIGDIRDAIKVVYEKLDGFYNRMDGVESRISAVEQASVFQKIGKRRPRREIREWKVTVNISGHKILSHL